jgi:hypothetical protein
MKFNLKRSKSYIAVLLGGLPADTDKVMELVADQNRRLSFIYGFNVFVLYFYSRESIDYIDKIFYTTLKEQVDMMFVFPNTPKTAQYLVPHVKAKLDSALDIQSSKIGSDLIALRSVLDALTMRTPMIQHNHQPQGQPHPQPQQEQPSEEDILNGLLMKMKATGYDSLSPAELDFLKTYKENHKKNNQNEQNDVD